MNVRKMDPETNKLTSRWEDLMKSVGEFMDKLARQEPNSRVTLILYDDISQVVFENEAPSNRLLNNIALPGYGTNFEKPLADAYRICRDRAAATTTFALYFMSDGSASFPEESLSRFEDPASDDLRGKIKFEAIAFGDSEFAVLDEIAQRVTGDSSKKAIRASSEADLDRAFLPVGGSSSGGGASLAKKDGFKCITNECRDMQRINLDGTCDYCPTGQKPSGDQKSC